MNLKSALVLAVVLAACRSTQSSAPPPVASTASPNTESSQVPPSASMVAPSSAPTDGFVPVPLPGASGGIGFDDLTFAPRLHRVLAPAGRTGKLDLIDPATRQAVG